MYRLYIRGYGTDAHQWWKNFTVVFRNSPNYPRVELEDYILEQHGGVYNVYNGGTLSYIDFETEEDATAFVLKYS